MGLLIFLCLHPFVLFSVIMGVILLMVVISPVVILVECLKKIFGPKVTPFVLFILIYGSLPIIILMTCKKHEPHPDYIDRTFYQGQIDNWKSPVHHVWMHYFDFPVYGEFPYCQYGVKGALCLFDSKNQCEKYAKNDMSFSDYNWDNGSPCQSRQELTSQYGVVKYQ